VQAFLREVLSNLHFITHHWLELWSTFMGNMLSIGTLNQKIFWLEPRARSKLLTLAGPCTPSTEDELDDYVLNSRLPASWNGWRQNIITML